MRIEDVVSFFHQLYYTLGIQKRGTWHSTFWMGVQTEKLPLDMWIYQELLFMLKPDLIIETGTRHGGSALFYCQMMDLIGVPCEIVTIDIERPANPPQHPRLTYLSGSSTAPDIVADVTRRASGKQQVMVVLDSDHRRDHVLAEMRAYHSLVTPGGYLIVEDTNVNGHPVWPQFGPGPMEAIVDFMRENQDFRIDRSCEKFLFTMHPNGWLRKRKPGEA
jgi:cephalosporin hydroxylase